MSSAGGDPVAAVTERAASGETAALFEDIRATLGVPVVNLVWRHLATMPGALAWVWGTVRPLYRTGLLGGQAEAFRQRMILPPAPPLPPAVLAAAGLSAVEQGGIGNVLASYDHSNTINLLALGAFLRRPDGAPARAIAPAAAAAAAPTVEELPRLLTFEEMAAPTVALVRQLNMLGERDEGRIVASMWRHLAHWPPFLALAWTALEPLEAGGTLRDAVAVNLAQAAALQDVLAEGLGQAAAPDAPVRTKAIQAVRTFVEHPIGKMVTTCRILRHSLDAGAAR